MKHEVLMPRLSDTVEEGVVVTWLVEPGSQVRNGQLIAEVQVEKVSAEVHAPVAGRISALLVQAGGVVAQGSVMATIEPEDATKHHPVNTFAAKTSDVVTATSPRAESRVVASPAARRLARDLGVDLAMIVGSGPGSRILEADINAASSQSRIRDARESRQTTAHPITRMRRVIADRLRTWQAETAQVTITTDADVTDLQPALKALTPAEDHAPSLTAATMRACVLALRDHLALAAQWSDDVLVFPAALDIGVAVALQEGLVVPVVRAADSKDVASLDREIRALSERARSGKLKDDELQGGVFSISNLGGFGIDTFTPLLNPPQSAILGIGRAKMQPTVRDGVITLRAKMSMSLTFDHRVVDGVPAARFLQEVVRMLEDHQFLLQQKRNQPEQSL